MRKTPILGPVLLIMSCLASLGSVGIRAKGDEAAVALLRAVRGDQVRPEEVKSSVRACLAMVVGGQDRCLSATANVLSELARLDHRQGRLIADALRQLQAEVLASAGATPISDMLLRLEATPSGVQASARQPAEDYWAELAGSSGPPTRADIGKLPATVFDARLHVFVRRLLDPAAATALREAFRVAAAEGCDGLLEGKAENVCRELGLWRVQRACLSVVFEELHGFTGEGSLVARFTSLDRELVENVAMRFQGSDDDGLVACLSLVQRWMAKQPTRWQAWADAMELLGSVAVPGPSLLILLVVRPNSGRKGYASEARALSEGDDR